MLRGGDALVAEDGSLVRVLAAPQPVLVVRHCPEHGRLFDLLRAAYHLGNRHVSLELQADHRKVSPFVMIGQMIETAAIRSDVKDFKIGPTSDATYMFKVSK